MDERADGQEIGCLLLDDDVTAEHYLVRYEASRDMSPFNTMLYATRNTDRRRVTLAFDTRFERRADGITATPLGDDRAGSSSRNSATPRRSSTQMPPDEHDLVALAPSSDAAANGRSAPG